MNKPVIGARPVGQLPKPNSKVENNIENNNIDVIDVIEEDTQAFSIYENLIAKNDKD